MEDKVTRKLLKTGEYTYMLTLPKLWVKALKLRLKNKVELKLMKDRIIIKRIKRAKKKKR